MRMQTWRLTSVVQAQLPLDQIATIVAEFDNSLTLLRHGGASRPLFAQMKALWRAERNQRLQTGGLDALDSQRLVSDFVTACEPFFRGAMHKCLFQK